jgi:hypothetical protein
MVEMRLSTQAITNAVAKRLSILAFKLLCLKVEKRREVRLQEQIKKIILKLSQNHPLPHAPPWLF